MAGIAEPPRAAPADEVERAVLDALDVDAMLAFLRELVAIPSVTGHEEAAQDAVARRLRALGLDVDAWALPLDELRRHPAYSAEVERSRATGVVGAYGADAGGRTLILNGHTDVVPAGDEGLWTRPPFECVVEDGQVRGRGALDMKGGLCCAIFAVDAVVRAGARLPGRVIVQSVVGEEEGGVGTLGAIHRGWRADGAVVMEPTRLAVAPAQAGALNFRLTVPGRSAHGAVRHEGVSALEKFGPIHDAVLRLERARNDRLRHPLFPAGGAAFPICIGTVRAGNWASNVPESLVCEGRYGVAPGETMDGARRELEDAVAAAAAQDAWLRENPPRLEWWGGQFEPAEIPADHPLTTTVSGALRSLGREPVLEGMPYGADMRLLVHHAATPTLMFGPGDIRFAHRPDERVPVDDLVTVARALAITIVRFCGG